MENHFLHFIVFRQVELRWGKACKVRPRIDSSTAQVRSLLNPWLAGWLNDGEMVSEQSCTLFFQTVQRCFAVTHCTWCPDSPLKLLPWCISLRVLHDFSLSICLWGEYHRRDFCISMTVLKITHLCIEKTIPFAFLREILIWSVNKCYLSSETGLWMLKFITKPKFSQKSVGNEFSTSCTNWAC